MNTVSLKDLLEAGCHFGHKSDRWHPKATAFIYQERDGIHVIDLVKTKSGLEAAALFIKNLALEGKKVLFLGTKRQAAPIIRKVAAEAGAPFIAQRWIGGFLTNWSEVHKNLEKIRKLTDEQTNGVWNKFPKHERVKLGRYLAKLNYLYSGVVSLTVPPDAVFVVDIRKEKVGVAEAKKMGMPVLGIVDTNSDPEQIDIVIPSNDDAVGAIELLVTYIAQAYKEGWEEREKTLETQAKQAAKEAEKAAKEAAEKKAEPVEKKTDVKIEKPAEKKAEPKKEAEKSAEVKEKPKKAAAKKKE